MNADVWGDEGNVPSNAKDTAMYQELAELYNKFLKWRGDYIDQIPNEETKEAVADFGADFSVMVDLLEVSLEP